MTMEVEEKTHEAPPPNEQREQVAHVEAQHPHMQAGETMYLVQSRCVREMEARERIRKGRETRRIGAWRSNIERTEAWASPGGFCGPCFVG